MIVVEDVHYQYTKGDKASPALKSISLTITEADCLGIIGPNGSGKSTLALCLNGLIQPTDGRVVINGLDTSDPTHSWEIYRQVGMIFQNPDNQLISTTVERELAFGLENIGLPTREIHERVEWALDRFHLTEYRLYPPHRLSGGEKQRLAIAAVVAMHPRYLVCDEATALLDPTTRSEIMSLILSLRHEYEMGIVYITQYPEEAVMMDHTILMAEGRIVVDAEPAIVFGDAERMARYGLDSPVAMRLAKALRSRQLDVPDDIVRTETLIDHISQWTPVDKAPDIREPTMPAINDTREPVVEFQDVTYTYAPDTILAAPALRGVSVRIYPGECVALIGPNGSGKSTFIQHINRLLIPASGTVHINGMDLADPAINLRRIRQQVGLIFQFPEAQLFEDRIFDDVAFGPRNMDVPEDEIPERVHHALVRVHLDPERFADRHPFSLSGGEKRRAAIAGILAMEPDILALDEPTAGLDPEGIRQIEAIFRTYRDAGSTLLLISHDMDLVARLADRVIVMKDGQIIADDVPHRLFTSDIHIENWSLERPILCHLLAAVRSSGIPVSAGFFDVEEAADMIRRSVTDGV